MVNDLGETEELLERLMAPRGPKKRQPGKEKMGSNEIALLFSPLSD
jgi:hypothetical protein